MRLKTLVLAFGLLAVQAAAVSAQELYAYVGAGLARRE